MAFYKSKYTGTEIDQRLAQATYDDAVLAGFEGSKEEFDAILGKLKEIADKAENSTQMESENLETFNKNVIDAINELHRELQAKPDEQDVIDQGELEVFKDEIAAKYATRGELEENTIELSKKADKTDLDKKVDWTNYNNTKNIVLPSNGQIFGDFGGSESNSSLLGARIYNAGLENEEKQVEVGTSKVHLNLNSKDNVTIETSEGKKTIATVDQIQAPYEINLTNLLSAEDSESISTAIRGIDNLNATVQDNRIIVGTISNGSVSVSIRILGNVTTLYYLLDSILGLTLNEIAITNTSGTLSKSITTHSVLTENMVINSLNSDETTLPLSAAQGKVLNTDKQSKTDNTLDTENKTIVGAINEIFPKATGVGMKDSETTGEIFNTYSGDNANTAEAHASHAEGVSNHITAEGLGSHAEGRGNTINGMLSHVEGYMNTVNSNYSHVEGQENTVTASNVHVERYRNTVSGYNTHVEGTVNRIAATNSHIEGDYIKTDNSDSVHYELGYITNIYLNSDASSTEVYVSYSKGFLRSMFTPEELLKYLSHPEIEIVDYSDNSLHRIVSAELAERESVQTVKLTLEAPLSSQSLSNARYGVSRAIVDNADHAHIEGLSILIKDEGAHSEGADHTVIHSSCSHSEGTCHIVENADESHVEGMANHVTKECEHAEGKWNISHNGSDDSQKTIHSLGFGSRDSRMNLHEIMQNGDCYIYGLGGYDGTNAIEETSQTLQEVVNSKQATITAGTGLEFEGTTLNVTLDTTVFKVVSVLPNSPTPGDENKIHLVAAESTGTNNVYTEYVWVNSAWEILGEYTSEVDLTPYLKAADAADTYLSKTDAVDTYATKTELADKQNATDQSLKTSNKTIVGAINEILPKATGVGKVDESSDGTGEIFNGYEGFYANVASGQYSHAEGSRNNATGGCSHAEGQGTTASGFYSHAEGGGTTASGHNSHAEGYGTIAAGGYSHAEGFSTQAFSQCEHAEGVFNKSYDSTDPPVSVIHSVGIGSSENDRKNANEIKLNGDHYIYGVGNFDGTNSADAQTLQEVINNLIEGIPVITEQTLSDNYEIPVNATNQEYIYKLTIGDTLYNITGASGITWQNGVAPITQVNKTYMISVINNLATWGEF